MERKQSLAKTTFESMKSDNFLASLEIIPDILNQVRGLEG